ncbi:MAG: FtsB family cell division protein [Thermodesulfobacteriota bacterium]
MFSRMRNRYLLYSVILCFVVLLLFVWLSFGQNGLLDLLKMQEEKRETVGILKDISSKNRRLASEIRRLRTDSEYFESVARKELGLVGENEIIYRMNQKEQGLTARPIQRK